MSIEPAEAISSMILSPSGWRGIFAEDGDEESPCQTISAAHEAIAAAAGQVFADYLSNTKGAIIVGRDTRPTGEAIAGAIIRALLSAGREVWYTGIVAAPEIMALARVKARGEKTDESSIAGAFAAGFVYISASHNPIGHNGIKFGLTDGGVLKAEEATKLTSNFKSFIASMQSRAGGLELSSGSSLSQSFSDVYARENEWKSQAFSAYRKFTEEVISGFGDNVRRQGFFSLLQSCLKKQPIGIVADFNGSARAASIDRDFFCSLGIGFKALNEAPGKIVNRIIPEGESLEPCRAFLENTHRENPSFVMGYMSDCDGDRGNLVVMEVPEQGEPKARVVEAQEVFALACVAELASLVRNGELKFDNSGKLLTKAALVINDPTSLRIDRIAGAFGVNVFRAEVGEANVVGLARKLREQGYLVRIFGEGSNGGSIIHPSAVRDPINTLGAVLKLLVIRREKGSEALGLFEIWCKLSGQRYREDFTLADIMNSLPAFTTTGVTSPAAVLKVNTMDHAAFKDKYQNIFLREWEEKKTNLLEMFGISEWEAIAYNGMEEKRGIKRFADAGNGGLKIEFGNGETKTAFLWMRGSGTEPVFRIIADAEGADPNLERVLIDWQRKMALEANSNI